MKMKALTGGEKGRHLWPRLVQKIAEGKAPNELSWKVKVMIKKNMYHGIYYDREYSARLVFKSRLGVETILLYY